MIKVVVTLWKHNRRVSLFRRQTSQTCCSVWTVLSVYLYRFQTNSCWKDSGQTSVCWHWAATGLLQIGNVHGKTRGHTRVHTILYADKCLTRTYPHTWSHSKRTFIIRPSNTQWYVFSRCSISQLSTQTWRGVAAGETCTPSINSKKTIKPSTKKSCCKATMPLKIEPQDVKAKLG